MKVNSKRYVFSVQSTNGFYIDAFKSADDAFKYCDHMRRCYAGNGESFFVVRETFRENRRVWSSPEVTVRCVFSDSKDIVEKTYFCSPAAAIANFTRIMRSYGTIKNVSVVERYCRHV